MFANSKYKRVHFIQVSSKRIDQVVSYRYIHKYYLSNQCYSAVSFFKLPLSWAVRDISFI